MGFVATGVGVLFFAIVGILLKRSSDRAERERSMSPEVHRLEDLDRRVHALEDALLQGRGGSVR